LVVVVVVVLAVGGVVIKDLAQDGADARVLLTVC
jgi:hypothetical protein